MTAGFYMSERFGAWQVGDDPDKGGPFKLFSRIGTRRPSNTRRGPASLPTATRRSRQSAWSEDFMSALGLSDVGLGEWAAMTKTSHAKGTVWTYQTPVELPKGFYQYKYLVLRQRVGRKVPDP